MDNIKFVDSLTFITQLEASFNRAVEEERPKDMATYALALSKEWDIIASILEGA